MVESQEMDIRYPGKIVPQVQNHFLSEITQITQAGLHFLRFGNPSQLPSPMLKDYKNFAQHFVTHFAPEIFTIYLQQVELYVSGQAWLSKKCQYNIFTFFTEWYISPDGLKYLSLISCCIASSPSQRGTYSSHTSTPSYPPSSSLSFVSTRQSKSFGTAILLSMSEAPLVSIWFRMLCQNIFKDT
jgi:hypothetical protein